MAEIKNLDRLMHKLQVRIRQAIQDSRESAVVGYTAAYALYVHENVEMKLKGQPRPGGKGYYWDPQGRAQAKFLEQPARTLSSDGTLRSIILQVYGHTKSLGKALLTAALRLQRESQQLCPVDTGNLRASAFTRLESR